MEVWLPRVVFFGSILAFLVLRLWWERRRRKAPPAPVLAASLGVQYQPAMQILLTVAILVAALYVILSQNFGEAAEKWATGAIGTLVGFWLSPKPA